MECQPKTPKPVAVKFPRNRYVFTIERDLHLLESTLNLNPYQLGIEKWKDVAADMSDRFSLPVIVRTVKERVQSLIDKYNKEELSVKTGSEEERTRRGELIQEIIALKESERRPISLELGAEDEVTITASNASRKNEKLQADKDRDQLRDLTYPDAAPDPKTTRVKRTRAAMEEDLIIEKCKHEMELERKRFQLDETVKIAQLAQEDERLAIEKMREQRLLEESKQRQEYFEEMKKMMNAITRNEKSL